MPARQLGQRPEMHCFNNQQPISNPAETISVSTAAFSQTARQIEVKFPQSLEPQHQLQNQANPQSDLAMLLLVSNQPVGVQNYSTLDWGQ